MAIVVVIFVVFGCVFFACFGLLALWWLCKKCEVKKKEEEKTKVDMIRADEHFKMKEDVMKGPLGSEAVVLTIDDDKHFEGEIIKHEKELKGKHKLGKHGEIAQNNDLESGESSHN